MMALGHAILRSTQNDAVLTGGDASVQAQIFPWLRASGTFETVDGENRDTGDSLPLLPPTRVGGELRVMQAERRIPGKCFSKSGYRSHFCQRCRRTL
ncbi:MAG: hypothetical protein U5K69_26285 [Balneolaceae bacterium]|nr:hypothetical protein [Balneolaceae bacterium]